MDQALMALVRSKSAGEVWYRADMPDAEVMRYVGDTALTRWMVEDLWRRANGLEPEAAPQSAEETADELARRRDLNLRMTEAHPALSVNQLRLPSADPGGRFPEQTGE